MRHTWNNVWLALLRSLIYLKRATVWVFQTVWYVCRWLYRLYRETVGFFLYRHLFRIRRTVVKMGLNKYTSVADILAKRETLQVIFFVVATLLMIPQTKLYAKDSYAIPGRKTLFYSVLGPGDQDYSPVEEISVNVVGTSSNVQQPAWRQGAVSMNGGNAGGTGVIAEPKEISSISSGGTAVTKPSILPGTVLPADNTAPSASRRGMTTYVVKSGDTLGQIASSFGVSVETILWTNNLSIRSYLRLGQELKILPGTGLLHTVVRGDTVLRIASIYKADAKAIIQANTLQNDGSDIVVGEQLFIPGGVKPQPVYVAPKVTQNPLRQVSAPPPSSASPAGSGYLWPTAVTSITQYFGWRHTGVDIAGPKGTPIYASRSGTIIKSQCGWNGGYGCYVIIDHGAGVHTLYGHNSELLVGVGQEVSQGQTIALMGSTGRSTGPHVHFEVRVRGKQQNPLQYVR